MKRANYLVYLLVLPLLGICSLVSAQQQVLEIQISGLKRVKEKYLMRFIESQPGTDFDSATFADDVQRLHNTQLFQDIQSTYHDSLDQKVLEISFRENFTLIPLVNFGTIQENFFLEAGVSDYNFLGRGNTLGLLYRWYDRHSLTLFFNARYLGQSRWGMYGYAAHNATLEPAYFPGDMVVTYEVDRDNLNATGRYELQYNHFLELGGGYIREKYVKIPEDRHLMEYGPDFLVVEKFQMRAANNLNRVNYFFQSQDGFQNLASVDVILSPDTTVLPFWKFENDFRYFKRIGKRGNFASRAVIAIADNNPSPFAPFVVDSYLNVRGSGNRIARGTNQTVLNLEYRHSFFDGQWGAVQGVAFVDHSMLRPPGGSIGDMFLADQQFAYGGLGGRLYLRKFYNFTLRADVGMNVQDWRNVGFVFGAGQYF